MSSRHRDEKRGLSHLAARAHRRAVRRRWTRRGLIALGALLIIGVGAIYTARGPLTRGVALAAIEDALGYEARAGAASLVTRNTVRLPNLTLRAPGVEGEAGVVLEAERVDLEVDWLLAALRPADAVRSIALQRPIARVGIDVETGELSLSSRRATAGDGAFPAELPPIRVEDATLVFGEHGRERDGPWFAALHRIRVTGVLAPPDAGSDVYALRLTEEASGDRRPAVLEGELDLKRGAGSFALSEVDFGALRAPGVAPPVRTPLRRLRVDGRLPLATLRFQPDGTYVARLALDGVDVGVPAPVLNPGAAGGDQTRPLELTGVTGEVVLDRSGLSANLIGLFGDIDARVLLETRGFSASADLSAEFITSDYTLGPTPELLPYAPELAAEFLQRFSGPEARVSGRVRLERSGGETTATGLFAWSEGSAAFEGFPYPIREISGTLSFNGDGIFVRDLRGAGPSGARVSAEIAATPIGKDSEIDATIIATGVPVDGHLLGAIEGERGEAVAGLFDASALPEETRAILPADYAAGGEIRLEILVTKRGGEDGEWNWDVLATADELEIAPAILAYPATARNFELRFDRFDAAARLPELIGPTGARGSATVDLRLKDQSGTAAFRPSVMFEVEGAPIDRMLLAAVRERAPVAADWIERLGVRGEIAASGEASTENGELSLRTRAPFKGVTFEAGGSRIAELDGEVRIEDERLSAQARGRAFGGSASLETHASLESDAWSVNATIDGLEISENAAAFLGMLSEGAGRQVSDLLDRWRPVGRLDLRVAAVSADAETEWSAALSGFDGLSAEVGDQRVAFGGAEGAVLIDGSSGLARFDGLRATASAGRGQPVRVNADGETRLWGDAPARLEIEAEDLRFESPIVRRLASRFGGERARALLEDANPVGAGDLSLVIDAPEREPARVRGTVRPSELTISRNDSRLAFDRVQGELRFGEPDVDASLRGLIVEAAQWRAMLSGEFSAGEFAGDVDLRASDVTPELLAGMPEQVAGIVRRIDLSIAEGGALWVQGRTDEAGGLSFRVGFEDASLEIGVPIEGAAGELTLSRAGEDSPIEGELRLDVFEAAGAPMERGAATIIWNGESGTLGIPSIEAICGGGAIRGRGRLAPGEGFLPTSEYLLDLRCSGVPLAWFIARPDNAADASHDELARRGLIGGRLTVRGGFGENAPERVGRGTFAIRGGEVLRLPLLTPALELLNLQPPVGEQLDDAAIEFGLIGDRLVFDRLFVQSKSIIVRAEGEANLADRSIELWVRSRGRRVVPVLSELVNALRDELVATRVSGPIADPSYEAVQLPNTRRLLLGAFAPGAAGESTPTPAPERPAMVDSVPLRPEPINE